jgi:hypothetical protein
MFSLRLMLACGFAAHVLAPASFALAAPPRPRPPIAEFDIGAEGDFIVLRLRIDQHEYPFLVNTGLPITVVDDTLCKKFDLRKLEPGPGASRRGTRRERFGGLRAALGNLRLDFPDGVESGDYTGMREGLDIDCFGEIGMDFLAPFIVQIDFDQGKLRLLSSLPPAPGEAIRIKQPGDENRVPTAIVSLAGQPAQKFIISTARSGNSIDVTPDLLAKLEENGKATNLAKERGVQRSGTRRFDAFRVDSALLGSIRTEGLICNSSEQNGLGLSYLARFIVTFDFPRGKMFLKKGEHFAEPDSPLDLEEVALERVGERISLRDVNAYGPAGRLGLRRGDVLESINGHDPRRMTNWQVRRLLGQPERAIGVVVRRGDEELRLQRDAAVAAPVATENDNHESHE